MRPAAAFVLSSFLYFTSAHPSPAAEPDASPVDLAPRSCATLGPGVIDILERGDPTNPHDGQIFNLARGSGPPISNDFISVVSFNFIPAGATGCQLVWQYPPFQYPNQITLGPATQADVWLVAPDPTGSSTWNSPPQRDQFVSTVIFPTEKSDQGFKTILWAGTCGSTSSNGDGSSTLSFLFEQSNWQQGGGSVRFFNTLGGKQGLQPLGFSLVFNC